MHHLQRVAYLSVSIWDKLHVSTIWQNINRYGINGRVAKRKTLLKKENTISNLNFVRKHLDKPEAFWRSILWTDESKIK